MKSDSRIPFNRPFETGREIGFIREAMSAGHLSGHGGFSRLCEKQLEELTGAHAVMLTPSCSAALEMAVILSDISEGDEVILPSFTFVSTANAVVLRGGIPVFVDIDPKTMNINVECIRDAINEKTKAIIVVHYGGVAADMEQIMPLAEAAGVQVIEDAAHCVKTSLNGRELGSFGSMATFSFHETKNIQCGEGGALVINDSRLVERAQIVQDKGTNRSEFLLGQTDKYTWVDVGSSFLPGELGAAFLYAQLQALDEITGKRVSVWERYAEGLRELGWGDQVRNPVIPVGCKHNGHLYYLILPSKESRDHFIARMFDRGVQTVFHYIPLHSSPGGRKYGRVSGKMAHTDLMSQGLVRLPVWPGMSEDEVETVLRATRESVFEVVGE